MRKRGAPRVRSARWPGRKWAAAPQGLLPTASGLAAFVPICLLRFYVSGFFNRLLEEPRSSTALAEIAAEAPGIKSALIDRPGIAATRVDFRTLFDSLPVTQRASVLSILVGRVVYDGEKGTVAISFHPAGIKALEEESV